MKVLICGGRNFEDYRKLSQTLAEYAPEIDLIIHGAARGADTLAQEWAQRHSVPVARYPAAWYRHGRQAGPIRNQQMLDEKPDLVIAFPGGRGTADMVSRAKAAGVKVVEVG